MKLDVEHSFYQRLRREQLKEAEESKGPRRLAPPLWFLANPAGTIQPCNPDCWARC